MRDLWIRFWAWITALINRVPQDKRLHFVAGFIIAAFFALSLKVAVCIVPVVFLGFIKEFIDAFGDEDFDWWDVGATALGGLLCQIFVVLGLWWFPACNVVLA